MKKIALIIGLLALVASTRAADAAPNSINFTGRLSTSSGPVNGNVDITFTFYTAQTGGSSVWSDTLTGLSATDGLVFATLGSVSNPLDETVFSDAPLYLEIIVGTETLSPRLPIQSVPYAVRATSAGSADTLGGTITPADVVTGVAPAANGGLTGGGSGGNVTLGVDTTTIQKRVSGTCASGAINTINADGTVSCASASSEVDGVIGNEVTNATDTSLTRSGSGTAASPYTLGVNTAVIQNRVGGTCALGNAIRAIAADGTVTCQAAGITSEVDGVIGNEVTNATDTTLTRSGSGTAASPYTLGVNTTVMQKEVTGTCAVGSSIRAINSDGTVLCQSAGGGFTTTVSPVPIPNNSAVVAGASFTNIIEAGSGLGTFTKASASTVLLVVYQGHTGFNPPLGVNDNCKFQLGIDGAFPPGSGAAVGPFYGPQSNNFIGIAEIGTNFSTAFTGISAGTHTLQLWAACSAGTSIQPNSGGFGDTALVIEM